MKRLFILIVLIFLVSCTNKVEKCLCPECSGWEQVASANKIIKSAEDAAFQLSFYLEEDIKEEEFAEANIEICNEAVQVYKSGQEATKARAIDSKGRVFVYYDRK